MRQRKVFGDFQTPPSLARRVVSLLSALIPYRIMSCGRPPAADRSSKQPYSDGAPASYTRATS